MPSAAGSAVARQARSCRSTTSMARPASRSASCSPTHRMVRRPWARAASSLRPMTSSVSAASRRRSECPTMTHVARPASIGAEIQPVYAPAGSWWTSWAPTATPCPSGAATSPAARASRTAARQTNGGQRIRTTPGSRVRLAISRASSPASAGVVFIFQLPATMTGRIARIMPEARPRPPPPARDGPARVERPIDGPRAATPGR